MNKCNKHLQKYMNMSNEYSVWLMMVSHTTICMYHICRLRAQVYVRVPKRWKETTSPSHTQPGILLVHGEDTYSEERRLPPYHEYMKKAKTPKKTKHFGRDSSPTDLEHIAEFVYRSCRVAYQLTGFPHCNRSVSRYIPIQLGIGLLPNPRGAKPW